MFKKSFTVIFAGLLVLSSMTGCAGQKENITTEEVMSTEDSNNAGIEVMATEESNNEGEEGNHWDALDEIKAADLMDRKIQIDDKIYYKGMSFSEFYDNITSSAAGYECRVANRSIRFENANLEVNDSMLVPAGESVTVFFNPSWSDTSNAYALAKFWNNGDDTVALNDLLLYSIGFQIQAEKNVYYGGGVRADGGEGIDMDGLSFVEEFNNKYSDYEQEGKSTSDGRIMYFFNDIQLKEEYGRKIFTGMIQLDQSTGNVIHICLWFYRTSDGDVAI